MTEIEVEFIYNNISAIVQCNTKENMKNIFHKFLSKTKESIKSVYFLYSGNKIDENKILEQIINNADITRKKMSILVYDADITEVPHSPIIDSNTIICPQCKS